MSPLIASMPKLNWTTDRFIEWHGRGIPYAKGLDVSMAEDSYFGQKAGVRRDSARRLAVKNLLFPVHRVWVHAAGTGFITRVVAGMLRRRIREESTFLEVGCGNMELRRYLPKGCVYNAIEMSVSEFTLQRVLAKDANVNFAFALATEIPLPSASVDIVASLEVFEHIPPIEDALREIRRVMKSGGVLVCSIPNNHYFKYKVVGDNPDHVNKWTFDEFPAFVERLGFRLIESRRLGMWIPIPIRGLREMYLPIRPSNEFYTSNFFYCFEAIGAPVA